VIDFLFLKTINSSGHFFETHAERFGDLAMYMEVALNSGLFLTIRRSVADSSEISFKSFEFGEQDWTDLPIGEWDHPGINFEAAKELLDGILGLSVISPYPFRKALTYFLRTQNDYRDVLQLQKFQAGRALYWKPFVMNLLGFDESLATRKYNLDKEIEEKENEKKKRESELQVEENDLSRLAAEIDNLRSLLSVTEGQIDSFQFSDEERRLMNELVNNIEVSISEHNESLYNIKVDIRNIEQALSRKITFRLKDIESIFEEVNIHFPDQIKRSYDELISFNKSLTKERNQALSARRRELLLVETDVARERNEQDKKRQEYKTILDSSDTLEKFKSLQKELAEQRARLTYLDKQYERLSVINDLLININRLKRERGEVSDSIRVQLAKDSVPRQKIAENFNNYCKHVLDHEGLFYLSQNGAGNVEFGIELKERIGSKISRQSEGKSYKQIICALFDLALLKAYENQSFYRFVYHDGILEGLDDRKKALFLDIVKDVVGSGNIQYMLSVIDSDIPRDVNGQRIEFSSEEIILQLHDGGDDGRTFGFWA